jgi:hypothetical protein
MKSKGVTGLRLRIDLPRLLVPERRDNAAPSHNAHKNRSLVPSHRTSSRWPGKNFRIRRWRYRNLPSILNRVGCLSEEDDL